MEAAAAPSRSRDNEKGPRPLGQTPLPPPKRSRRDLWLLAGRPWCPSRVGSRTAPVVAFVVSARVALLILFVLKRRHPSRPLGVPIKRRPNK